MLLECLLLYQRMGLLPLLALLHTLQTQMWEQQEPTNGMLQVSSGIDLAQMTLTWLVWHPIRLAHLFPSQLTVP
jgi:hypothetical protein